jgi:hypothetical protein
MDHGSFDRVARLLAGGATRRSGLRALVGAMFGGPVAVAAVAADAEAAKKERRGAETRGGEDEVDAEKRPCGPKARDNRCRKHKDCCTKYCQKPKGKAKIGRCRCIKPGKKCKGKQKCCGGAICQNRKCTKNGGVPTAAPCVSGETCAAEGAVCTAYTDAGAPSGTHCTLPLGSACTGDPDCTCYHCGTPNLAAGMERAAGAQADLACCHRQGLACQNPKDCCSGWECESGTCCSATGTACTADADCCGGLTCQDGACAACVETVCASGCLHTTIAGAYAAAAPGDTIYIGPGTYPTGMSITKDITLTTCPGVTGVVLVPDGVYKDSSDSYYAILGEDSVDTSSIRSVTLRNLGLKGTQQGITDGNECLLISYNVGLIEWTIENCTCETTHKCLEAWNHAHTVKDSTFTDVTYAVHVETSSPIVASTTLDVTGCTFTATDASLGYRSIEFIPSSVDDNTPSSYTFALTVSDSTFNVVGDGAAIYFEGGYGSAIQKAKTTAALTNLTFLNVGGNGLQTYGGTASVTNCTFTGLLDAPITIERGDVTVTDCTFKDSVAQYYAGGIYVEGRYDTDASATIAGNTTFDNCSGGNAVLAVRSAAPFTAKIYGVNESAITNSSPKCYKYVDGSGGSVVPCDQLDD